MIRITISEAAFAAIAGRSSTTEDRASGANRYGPARNGVPIWLAEPFVERLGAMRGPGESYSDVILRLASE